MAEEEEEAAWDLDARGAAFLKRFLTRFQVQAVHRELYGAWRVWLDKFKEEVMSMLRHKGVDTSDKLEEPFHSSLRDLDMQIAEAARHTVSAPPLLNRAVR